MRRTRVSIEINGQAHERAIEPRLLLSDFIRHEAGLTGTHVGCEHGMCGACTIHFDGQPVRACLMLAVAADGHVLRTVEDLAGENGTLHPLQQAFQDAHGLQCGFCTPGFLMAMEPVLADAREYDRHRLRDALSGNLCRCTGYQNIVEATALAAQRLAGGGMSQGEAELKVDVPAASVWPELAGAELEAEANPNWATTLRPIDADHDERVASWELDARERGGSGHLVGVVWARVIGDAAPVRVRLTLKGRLAAADRDATTEASALLAAIVAALASRLR